MVPTAWHFGTRSRAARHLCEVYRGAQRGGQRLAVDLAATDDKDALNALRKAIAAQQCHRRLQAARQVCALHSMDAQHQLQRPNGPCIMLSFCLLVTCAIDAPKQSHCRCK